MNTFMHVILYPFHIYRHEMSTRTKMHVMAEFRTQSLLALTSLVHIAAFFDGSKLDHLLMYVTVASH